jgi:hypothetical protein
LYTPALPERRLVHHQLHPHVRRVADRLPRGVPAGGRPGPDPAGDRSVDPEDSDDQDRTFAEMGDFRWLTVGPELQGRGVEFVESPEERPYGIDSSFRDPSGNHIRLTQVREMATT